MLYDRAIFTMTAPYSPAAMILPLTLPKAKAGAAHIAAPAADSASSLYCTGECAFSPITASNSPPMIF
jgi:hypothetical protein